MADEDLHPADGFGEEAFDEDRRDARSRIAAVLVLLLLLLMCVVTTGVKTFFEYGPATTKAIAMNAECLVCHTELIPSFAKPAVHNPFATRSCRSCHTPHGLITQTLTTKGGRTTWRGFDTALEWLPLRALFVSYEGVAGMIARDKATGSVSARSQDKGGTSELVAPLSELCWTCHAGLGPKTSMPAQHPPFDEDRCTTCHDPHASDFRTLLIADERDLCVMCHPVAEELARVQKHPPFEQRYCTQCHDPHASEYTGILVDNQRDLCFGCHQGVAQLSNKAVQHQPFVYDQCTGCHEPHAADTQPLLVEAHPDLCYSCHPGVRSDFQRPSRHPVGVALSCPDCHHPHAADYEALIVARDNDLCYRCHAEAIQASYEGSRHQPLLCIRCHTPHGSTLTPMLRAEDPDLCLRCHATFEGKNKHPVRPVSRPRYKNGVMIATYWSEQAMTCSLRCHSAHGAPYEFMTLYPYRRDQMCLVCHPAVGKSF